MHCFQFAVSPTLKQTSAFKPRHTQKVGDFNDSQKKIAYESLKKQEKKIGKEIITAIEPAGIYSRAEEYHQKYVIKTGRGIC